MGSLAKQMSGQSQVKCFAKGGAVHDDAAQDKVLIKKMIKAEGKKEAKSMKKGGKAKGGCK